MRGGGFGLVGDLIVGVIEALFRVSASIWESARLRRLSAPPRRDYPAIHHQARRRHRGWGGGYGARRW